MGVKIEANKSNGGIKISALGEELRVDPRQIVAAAKEAAMENAKVPASWVTAGQADRLRAKFGGHTELKAKIERKLRYMESALDTPSPAPKVETSIKTQSVKLGKRTFESDRRSIFGVVARPGAVEIPTQKAADPAQASAPASVSAPVETPTEAAPAAEPSTLAVPLPAPKKFIQVTVAPPIRREPGSPDPRFGVIVPSPEIEKKEASTAIWGNLNDGHAPVDFAKSNVPIDVPEAVEELKATAPVIVVEEAKKESPKPASPKAHVESVRVENPVAPAAVVPHAQSHDASTRKRTMDVPVKWEPKNKAFGSKVKHKTKVQKKLEALGVIGKESEKKKSSPPKKHDSKPAAKLTSEPVKHESKKTSERNSDHGHEKKEGVLKRLIRKIFK